jgi:malate synthase
MASFDAVLGDKPNQKDRLREDVDVKAADLIAVDSLHAKPTYPGLVNAVQVGIRYIEAWLRGLGAVAIFNLMEDAATAEISRSQIWQWINAGVEFENGRRQGHSRAGARGCRRGAGEHPRRDRRGRLRRGPLAAGPRPAPQVALDDDYADFLTLPAYEQLKG